MLAGRQFRRAAGISAVGMMTARARRWPLTLMLKPGRGSSQPSPRAARHPRCPGPHHDDVAVTRPRAAVYRRGSGSGARRWGDGTPRPACARRCRLALRTGGWSPTRGCRRRPSARSLTGGRVGAVHGHGVAPGCAGPRQLGRAVLAARDLEDAGHLGRRQRPAIGDVCAGHGEARYHRQAREWIVRGCWPPELILRGLPGLSSYPCGLAVRSSYPATMPASAA
jgi:hypothetical protein